MLNTIIFLNELNLSAYSRTSHTKEEWLHVSGETERGVLFTGCTHVGKNKFFHCIKKCHTFVTEYAE
jgi:hypothetical protein